MLAPSPSGSKSADVGAILGVGKNARSRIFRPRNITWAVLVVVAIAGIYLIWSLRDNQAAASYITEPVIRGNLTVIVTATGAAQPITQVNVSSELSGTIRKVHVDYNSPVKVGQPLAELDTDKLRATVDSVRARLDAARAKVADTSTTIEERRAEFERKKELLSKGASTIRDLELTKAAYDRAVAAHTSALAEVKVVEADLRLSEINLAKACICSPIDGVVLKRSVDPGQIVASSLQAPVLFVIAQDLRHMELQVDIDEADVGKVSVGQKATFSVDAYPDRKFPASIRDIRFGSEVVQGVVTYKAVLSIDNAELMIRPGMTATAEVVIEQVNDTLLVPNAALRFAPASAMAGKKKSPGLLSRLLPKPPGAMFRRPSEPEGSGPNRRIWVLRDGVPVPVPVVIGASDGRRTEIRKGAIQPDEPIIVDTTGR
ncbi:MAG TPA: efflux RND transporter periplasmic adaptor subunit [Xanthobacteraceae bacterium]|nr:efflux RND transporter periplasmic adaptor subunit [Xanthobacteraceae bacterium]